MQHLLSIVALLMVVHFFMGLLGIGPYKRRGLDTRLTVHEPIDAERREWDAGWAREIPDALESVRKPPLLRLESRKP